LEGEGGEKRKGESSNRTSFRRILKMIKVSERNMRKYEKAVKKIS